MPNIPQQMQLPGLPPVTAQQPSGWRLTRQRIWRFLTRLWANREDAADAYHWVNRWLRYAIIAALFELVIVAAVAGTVKPIWVKALIGIGLPALTILVPVILVPAIVGTIWAIPRVRRVLFWIITIVAVQSLYGIYLAFVPVSNNPGLLVLQVALMWVVVLLAWPARRYNLARGVQVILVMIVLVTTAAFYAGSYDKLGKKVKAIGNDDAKAAPAMMPTTATQTFRIAVPGGNRKSEPWDLDRWTPTVDDSFRWWGPPGTLAHFEDGTSVSLFGAVGERTGKVRFTSPVAGQIKIEVTHHRG